jgi:hypothetical protein
VLPAIKWLASRAGHANICGMFGVSSMICAGGAPVGATGILCWSGRQSGTRTCPVSMNPYRLAPNRLCLNLRLQRFTKTPAVKEF